MSRYAFSQDYADTRDRREFLSARRTLDGGYLGGKRARNLGEEPDSPTKRLRTAPNARDAEYEYTDSLPPRNYINRAPRATSAEIDRSVIYDSPPRDANVTIRRTSNRFPSNPPPSARRTETDRPRNREIYTFNVEEGHTNEPIDQKFLLSCFQKQNHNFNSMIEQHKIEVDNKINKIDTKITNLQTNLPDMIDQRIKVLQTQQKTDQWRNDVLQDIADHEKRVMFYNVPKANDSEAEVWVDSFIRDHQLTEQQINGLKYTTIKALDNTTQDNRNYGTRHVQVIFPNIDFKGIIFQILIKSGKIPPVKYLKLKDSYPKLYRGKVQEFEKKVSDYRIIHGDSTFIKIENMELQAWRLEEGKAWVLEYAWTPSEPQNYTRHAKNKRTRLPKTKNPIVPQSQNGIDSTDNEMETNHTVGRPATLAPGVKLTTAALNNIRLSLLIFVNIDLKDQTKVNQITLTINQIYSDASVPYIETKRGAKCMMTLFDSKENLIKGKDAMQVVPKPFPELKFAKLNNH